MRWIVLLAVVAAPPAVSSSRLGRSRAQLGPRSWLSDAESTVESLLWPSAEPQPMPVPSLRPSQAAKQTAVSAIETSANSPAALNGTALASGQVAGEPRVQDAAQAPVQADAQAPAQAAQQPDQASAAQANPQPAANSASAAPVLPESGSSTHEVAAANVSSDYREPRIYILFLATDKISNLAVWNKFFEGVDTSKYRAFVHCKQPSCVQQVSGSFIVPVPTVGSWYCTDLVSPMTQLLSFALQTDLGPSNPADKFAFVSDSSLPAKPFSEVYNQMVGRSGSDFCVFPTNEWADRPSLSGDLEMVPKIFQWLTLTRAHAVKATDAWNANVFKDFMNMFALNKKTWGNDNNFGDSRNWGCLDEFWFMAALIGPIPKVNPKAMQFVHLDGVGESGNINLEVDSQAGWQGSCDTFVMWVKYANVPGRFSSFLKTLDTVSMPHPGNFMRPGWWDTISAKGISAIRNSDFLFVRKFIDNPTLSADGGTGGDFAETYAKIVYSADPYRSV